MITRVARTKYDRVVVENPYRTDALSQFVAELERKGEWPGIIFVRKRRHAELFAEALSKALGKPVPAVTSASTTRAVRESLAARMRAREPSLPVAVATAVWSTGLNVPTLAWVMMAGSGQAPIGLKQGAGRTTRPDEDKPGYVVYDVQDIGPGTEAQQAQSALRMKHYADAGFAAGEVRLQPEEALDEDAQALAQLLSLEDRLPVRAGAPGAPVAPAQGEYEVGRKLGVGYAWFWLLLIIAIVVITARQSCNP